VFSFKEISRRLFGMAEEHHVNNILKSIVLHSVNLLRSGIKGRHTKWDSNPCTRGQSKGECTWHYSHAREANISQYQCLGLSDVQPRLLLLTHAQDVNTDVAIPQSSVQSVVMNRSICVISRTADTAAGFDGRVLVTGKYIRHFLFLVCGGETQCIGSWLFFHYQTNLRNTFCFDTQGD